MHLKLDMSTNVTQIVPLKKITYACMSIIKHGDNIKLEFSTSMN
jgi:hypothetical protein